MKGKGKGSFVTAVRALAKGGAPKVQSSLEAEVLAPLGEIERAGFGRYSRSGWYVVDHPCLGQLSWKSGRDFRSFRRYFLLRLNGTMILHAWPDATGAYPSVRERFGSLRLWEVS